MRKLHIGGTTPAEGWEIMNICDLPHVDHLGNANDLSRFPDGTIQEIYASHILEHFDYQSELQSTLNEWYRVMRPFGTIYVSVPDLDALATLYLDSVNLTVDERFALMRMIFGGHTHQNDFHQVGLNEDFLTYFLHQAGFSLIQRVETFGLFSDTSSLRFKDRLISLNMVARKLPAAV
ncbi:methyltransferase domain-containing protein [Geomonas sp. Red32]|uniref:class I SAM-dependent methyltransferase n=1 Tax=Geomonas sp. Red32 TaxID=2912856 RepID=UPI00202CE9EB|nr:methyltransferase domain-containing protein [Geomonas sp. Red32]MCM0081192.1 methyltransferase domain-containing protein [Geomonas sp. Red32]